MKRLGEAAIAAVQLFLYLILGLLVLFWAAVIFNSISKFIGGGTLEVERWYIHIMVRPNEVMERRIPGWGTIALRFGEAAITTVMAGIAVWKVNRRSRNKPLAVRGDKRICKDKRIESSTPSRRTWLVFLVVQLFGELGPWVGSHTGPYLGSILWATGMAVMIPGRLLALLLTEKVLRGVSLAPVQMTVIFVAVEVSSNALFWFLCACWGRAIWRKLAFPTTIS